MQILQLFFLDEYLERKIKQLISPLLEVPCTDLGIFSDHWYFRGKLLDRESMLVVFELKSHSLSEGGHIQSLVKTLLNLLLVTWDLGIDVSEVANLASCLGNFVEEDGIVRG